MRMGLRPPLLSFFKTRKTKIIMGHFDELMATKVVANSVDMAGTLKGSQLNVIVTAVDRTLTTTESGSLVVVDHTAKVITLPAAAAGLNYKITFKQDPEAGMTILAASGDAFYGNIKVISTTADHTAVQSIDYDTAVGTPANYDNLDFVHDTSTLGGVEGDTVSLYCVDDKAWLVDATLASDHANPGSIAVINAG